MNEELVTVYRYRFVEATWPGTKHEIEALGDAGYKVVCYVDDGKFIIMEKAEKILQKVNQHIPWNSAEGEFDIDRFGSSDT